MANLRSFTPKKENKPEFETCLQKILTAKTKVDVNTISGTTSHTIDEIISSAQKKGKTVIFTFTPGPYKTTEELPKNWMSTDAAKGCTPQLNAFEKALSTDLDALVYAVNTQTTEYQTGENGLLAVKKLKNLFMISDAEGKLQEALGLPTFDVKDHPNESFLERFTIVIKPNGEAKVFELSSPVNDQKADDHLKAIKTFISPEHKAEYQAPQLLKV